MILCLAGSAWLFLAVSSMSGSKRRQIRQNVGDCPYLTHLPASMPKRSGLFAFTKLGLLNLGDLPRGVKLVTCRRGSVLRVGDLTALVDFSDQITKIYHQGARAAQPIFEQPRRRHHTFEHRDEMRRDRIPGRSQNTLLNSERQRSPKFTRAPLPAPGGPRSS